MKLENDLPIDQYIDSESLLHEGNSPPIFVNFLAGNDEDLGFERAIFRDFSPEYGIVKL